MAKATISRIPLVGRLLKTTPSKHETSFHSSPTLGAKGRPSDVQPSAPPSPNVERVIREQDRLLQNPSYHPQQQVRPQVKEPVSRKPPSAPNRLLTPKFLGPPPPNYP